MLVIKEQEAWITELTRFLPFYHSAKVTGGVENKNLEL